MNAAQWAARFAAKPRPTVPAQANARFAKAVGLPRSLNRPPAPSRRAPSVVQPGMVHRFYPVLPPRAADKAQSAVAGMVGGAGYTHSTAPGSQHLYTPKVGPGYS